MIPPLLRRLCSPALFWTLLALLVTAAGCSRQRKTDRMLSTADQDYQARQFEKAKIEYVNILRQQPTNSIAILRLGKILFRQGQFEESFSLLQEGRKRFPNDIEAGEQMATLYLGAGQFEQARAEAIKVLNLQPTNESALGSYAGSAQKPAERTAALKQLNVWEKQAGDHACFHVTRAQIALRQNDTNTFETELRKALTLDPKSPSAQQTLGIARWSRGATNEAEQAFRTASRLARSGDVVQMNLATFLIDTGRIEDAKTVLTTINREAPERTAAWVAHAEIYLGQTNYAECDRLLSRALGQAPNDVSALLLRAQLRLAEKKPAEAVKLLKAVAEHHPRYGLLQYRLGVAQMMNEELTDAIASLNKAITLDPNNTDAALLLAQINLSRGQPAPALASLVEINRRQPKERSLFLLARAYAANGRPQDAIAVFRSMRTNFPNNPSVPFQLGMLLGQRPEGAAEARANLLEARRLAPDELSPLEALVEFELSHKQPAKALSLLQPELDRKPKSGPLLLLRARVDLIQQDYKAAESALDKAIEVQPDFQPAYMLLAELYQQLNKPKDSIQRLQDLLKQNPKNVQAMTLIGMIQSQLGNNDEAQRFYEDALKIATNYPLALNNHAVLLADVHNRLEDARAEAIRAHQLVPADPSVADTLGWIEYRRGNYPEALRLLNESWQKLAGQPEIEAHLGLIRYMMGQEDTARVALTAALKSTRKFPTRDLATARLATLNVDPALPAAQQIETFEQRRKNDPNDIVALLHLAKARETNGDITGARENYEAALKLNPGLTPALLRLATLEADRDPAKALQMARQAQQAAPTDPEVALTLGRIALRSGDAATAYGLLQNPVRQLATRSDAWFDLATAAFGVGRLEEAAEAMRTAARLGLPASQTHASQNFLVALAYAQAPITPAPAVIEEALKGDPNNGPTLYAQALAYELQGKFPEARDSHEKLLARYAAFTPSIRQLAILYAERLNNDAKAFELATKARTALPKDDRLAQTLAGLADRRGDHRYAVQLLTEVARNRPQDATVQFALGRAYLGLKQLRDARAALERALKLDPTGTFVPEAKKLLTENKAG